MKLVSVELFDALADGFSAAVASVLNNLVDDLNPPRGRLASNVILELHASDLRTGLPLPPYSRRSTHGDLTPCKKLNVQALRIWGLCPRYATSPAFARSHEWPRRVPPRQ